MALRPTLKYTRNFENNGMEDVIALKLTSGFINIKDVKGIKSELVDKFIDLPSYYRLRYFIINWYFICYLSDYLV
jgi:hypothetical protein